MKILYITTVGGTMDFFTSFIQSLLDEGNTVDIATNENSGETKVPDCYREWGCRVFPISCTRSPLDVLKNIKTIKEIRQLVKREKYDIVHCHTPIAAFCTRIACRKLREKQGVKVIYTAHGFHFYDGAPIKNWLLFYPVEWVCSWWTDVLITINKEDYERAKKHFHAKKTVYIPGVGVDTKKFAICNIDKHEKRQELGLNDTDFVLLSVGELSERKNQKVIIDALGKMKTEGDLGNIVYLAVGEGYMREEFEALIKKYALEDRVHLLGYRTDIDELCEIANCFVHTSVREGLGIAPLEAMAAGLPLISANINGIKDYTEDGVSGCCINPTSVDEMVWAISKMRYDSVFRETCGAKNLRTVKTFDLKNSSEIINAVYDEFKEGIKHLRSILIRQKVRQELGIKIDDFVVISVGELNKNKNHQVIIRSIQNSPSNVKYILVGKGQLTTYLKKLSLQLGVENKVIFTGFRTEVKDLLLASDCFAFPSIREGLGLAAIEAMSLGLPVIGHNVGGVKDYLLDGETGFFANTPEEYSYVIKILQKRNVEYYTISSNAIKKANLFDCHISKQIVKGIYKI